MYSEKVKTEDIQTWLSFYCTVQRGMELRDEDGIRTGARRFFVRLKRVTETLQHLPSIIQLGPFRGHVFYAGQPKECRKCGSLGHLAAECTATFCRNCRSVEHNTKDCKQPTKCNLCGATNHTFRACPHTYANRVRQNDPYRPEEVPQQNQPPLPQSVSHPKEPSHQGEPQSNVDQQLMTEDIQKEHHEQTNATEGVKDWSFEPLTTVGDKETCMTSTPNHPTQLPISNSENLLANKKLDDAESRSTVIFPQDLLDALMSDPPVTSSELPLPANQTSIILLEAAGVGHLSPSMLTDSSSEVPPMQSRKRHPEKSDFSSGCADTDTDEETWPASTSTPFLDSACLSAFSTATQMMNMVGEKDKRVKSKKKKEAENSVLVTPE
uniref:CCHC-type domain-containing protein n=1 Tax=Esox lucius TaxID=8010 RepID=A0AAY5L9I7_ESOLU